MQRVTDAAGVTHLPGDIVDLPASYEGEAWLERVDPEPAPVAPPAKLEPVEAPVSVPLEASAKSTRKKSRS